MPRDGEIGRNGSAPGPVAEAGEEGRAVGATGRRARGFLAMRGHAKAVLGHPVAELVQDVEGGVEGAADCGVVSFAFAIVFPPGHVNGCGPVEAGNY